MTRDGIDSRLVHDSTLLAKRLYYLALRFTNLRRYQLPIHEDKLKNKILPAAVSDEHLMLVSPALSINSPT